MSDEKGFRAIVKLNAPPTAQFESGDSVILQGDDLAQIDLMLNGAEALTNSVLRRILDAHKGNVVTAEAVATAAPTVVLTPEQAAQAMGVPIPTPVAVAAAPAPVVAAPAPVVAAPVAAPVAPVAPPVQPTPGQMPELVDGGTVGGTPGQRYPAAPGGQALVIGGACGKCGVVTYWQPPGVNYNTKQPYQGYYRCPNAKNHPK